MRLAARSLAILAVLAALGVAAPAAAEESCSCAARKAWVAQRAAEIRDEREAEARRQAAAEAETPAPQPAPAEESPGGG